MLNTDVKGGFAIWGLEDLVEVGENQNEVTVAKGDTITINCGATASNYSNDVEWLLNSSVVENTDRISVERSYTDYSNRIQLTIKDITDEDSSTYTCRAQNTSNYSYKYIDIKIVVSGTL